MTNSLLSHYPKYDRTQIHALNNNIAYVLMSGGLDSTTALWWALENYGIVKAYIVDYNQQHKIETQYAISVTKMVGVEYEIIHIDFPEKYWGIENKLTRGQACLMNSLVALDISNDGADIVHGILQTDDYGDCDRTFLDSLAAVLFHPNDRHPIGIATPLRAFDSKADVIAYAYQIGAPILNTWTCRSPFMNRECGECVQCKQRTRAFNEFVEKYGVTSETYNKWFSMYGSPYHPVLDNRVPSHVDNLLNTFVHNRGIKTGKSCLCYEAPDGKIRVASHICNLPRKYKQKGMWFNDMLSIHGYSDDGYRWELCVDKNNRIAATDYLPESSVIEKMLIDNIEV